MPALQPPERRLVRVESPADSIAAFPASESAAQDQAETSAPRSRKIRVFLLLENRLLREMLARTTRRCRDLEVAGEGAPAGVTPEKVVANGCDVLLWDFTDPRWLAFSAAQQQLSEGAIQIVAIGMESSDEHLLRSVRSGISGYLLKDASVAEVLAAVRAAFSGDAICPPKLCRALFRAVAGISSSGTARPPTSSGLTLRQQRVMRLVASGLTNKEVASELCLSELTVKNHMSRIMKQLNVANRSEAAAVLRASGYDLA